MYWLKGLKVQKQERLQAQLDLGFKIHHQDSTMLDFAFLRDDFILQQALPIDYICPKGLSLPPSSQFYSDRLASFSSCMRCVRLQYLKLLQPSFNAHWYVLIQSALGACRRHSVLTAQVQVTHTISESAGGCVCGLTLRARKGWILQRKIKGIFFRIPGIHAQYKLPLCKIKMMRTKITTTQTMLEGFQSAEILA